MDPATRADARDEVALPAAPGWTEDGAAIALGLGALLLGLFAHLATPALADALGWTVGKVPTWRTLPSLPPSTLALCAALALVFALTARTLGDALQPTLRAFPGVFALATLAFVCASQAQVKEAGFGYAAWAILLGLLVSNSVGTPAWMRPALRGELYIKAGLVLLGGEVLFGKVLAIGAPGLLVAWVVTPCVLVTTYWFGQRVLRMQSKTLNITISADMSVCGVSAAIATAAACRAKKEELTLAVGLSLVFTSVMMVAMPAAIAALGMDEVLGGAWIGGTLDATGAVAAAGAFLGERALHVAATIKMIQNILIGVIAFGVAVYFARTEEGTGKVGPGEIWRRFPRFVLGFVAASVLFSLLHELWSPERAEAVLEQGVLRGFSKNLRAWLFCLAFVSIGLSTNFRALREQLVGGKPLWLYVAGQGLNLCATLLMAKLAFHVLFPSVTDALDRHPVEPAPEGRTLDARALFYTDLPESQEAERQVRAALAKP